MKPRILFIDIETAPNIGYTWGKWETDVMAFLENWYILCFSYCWLDEKVKCVSIPDFHGYKKTRNDKEVVKRMWDLLNEADVVVAQNGDNFDIKKINTRFLIHELPPPAPYKTVDTLKVARNKFAFNSNKLDDLGKDLGIGEKIHHTGFNLWLECMNGEKKGWDVMRKYNKQDVELLVRLYKKELPYISNHPNLDGFYKGIVCPKCGSGHIQWRGYDRTKVSIFKRFQCQKCGGWGRFNQANKVSNVVSL